MNKMQNLIRQFAASQDKSIMLSVIEELQQGERLWIAYSPVTKNHYVEYHGDIPTAFVFSDVSFCAAFQEYLASKKIKISPMESDRSARVSMFSDLYRNGIEQVIVDNGQMFVVISLTEIINRPDFSVIPEQQRPILNPVLMRSANLFFQSKDADEKNPQINNNFMWELYQAKYLLPLVLDGQPPKGTVIRPMTIGGASLTLPVIDRSDGGCYIPVFTDWVEFSKMDKEKTCVGNVITFADMERFCSQGEYIIINPAGFNMIVDKTTMNTISRRFGTAPAAEVPKPIAEQAPVESSAAEQTDNGTSAAVSAVSVPSKPPLQQPQFEFYDLTSVPNPMIQKLNECLSRTPGIKKAYLRGLRQNGRESYLCIVDFSGTDPAVFQQMAQEVGPLTGGMALNFLSYQTDIGRSAAGHSYPFFTD